MEQRELKVKLLRVAHTGTYIGNQWQFEIIINGNQIAFNAPKRWELRPGESEIVTHKDVFPSSSILGPLVVFEKKMSLNAFPFPIDIYVKATDSDKPPTHFSEEGRKIWKENYGEDDEGSQARQIEVTGQDSQIINIVVEVIGDGLAERDAVTKQPHRAELLFVFEVSS